MKCPFGFRRKMTLTFYMRSGNAIVVKDVVSYTFDAITTGIEGVSIEYATARPKRGKPRLLVSTIDMSQVEAIVRS